MFLQSINRKQECSFFRNPFLLLLTLLSCWAKQKEKGCNWFSEKQYRITMQPVLRKQSLWYNAIIKPLKINRITSWFYCWYHISVFQAESSISSKNNLQKAVTVLLKATTAYITSILYSKFRLSALLSVFTGCIIHPHWKQNKIWHETRGNDLKLCFKGFRFQKFKIHHWWVHYRPRCLCTYFVSTQSLAIRI